MASQVAGYTVKKSSSLNLSVDEAVTLSNRTLTFLAEMLQMLEPQQVKTNEIAKDVYHECLQLRDYISEKLWSVYEADNIIALQGCLDRLSSVCVQYEMMKDAAEGDWELVDICVPTC